MKTAIAILVAIVAFAGYLLASVAQQAADAVGTNRADVRAALFSASK